jgi:hypothetical protein
VPLNDIILASLIWIGVNALPVAFIGLALLRERVSDDRPARARRSRVHPSVG